MSDPFPIGQRESQVLEFKAADALKKPFTISREVVAMLNAQGGDVWVGIRDQDDVATAFESIADADAAKKNLLNHLESVMDPKPDGSEVKLEVVDAEPGKRVLRIHVQPREDRRPYAYQQDGRHFVMRLDHRVRAMSRDEIFRPAVRDDSVRAELGARRDTLLKKREALLWMGVRPQSPLTIDVQASSVGDLLTNPSATGNRRSGWSRWHALGVPQFAQERVRMGDPERGMVELFERGAIDFTVLLRSLTWHSSPAREIVPIALLESVVSITRLASSVYRQPAAHSTRPILFDIALTGIKGWTLPAYPHGTNGYEFEHESPREFESDTCTRREPLEVPWSDLLQNPDRVGIQLVRSVYQAVGLTEDRMPLEFDRASERLTLHD